MAKKAKEQDMTAPEAQAMRNWMNAYGWSGKSSALAHLLAARKRRGNGSTLGAAKVIIEEFHSKVLTDAERVEMHEGAG